MGIKSILLQSKNYEMSYNEYLDECFGKDHRLNDDFLKTKLITVATKWTNYHNTKILRSTNKSLLLELTPENGETFVAWASKSLMTVINGEAGRLYITLPDWFTFTAIK